ncbi:40S ribosomal protein S6-A [Astathelohania contejeani]|uniref:40S ribosomal protein S6 n=1 Tax=Astathelohania contejeani TaxID=164912 RepID=A0ABQ7HZ01_9MICR|nr:40S ribosomal protein S6-A [Thelohania contejeani]
MFTLDSTAEMRLYDKKLGDIIMGDLIGPEFAGYKLKLVGGDDKQGFPMRHNLNTAQRVKLLLSKGDKGYRCRRDGVRRRKSVRGSIISSETNVLAAVIVEEGPAPIPGITDEVCNRSHLPKRASKLRSMFNIPEGADLKKEIIKKIRESSDGPIKKMPRIRITRLNKKEMRMKLKRRNSEEKAKRLERVKQEREEFLSKYGSKLKSE